MRRMLASILMVLGVVIALVLVLLLIASAVTSEGATQIARDGKTALQSEAALSSISSVRNASINAVLVAEGAAVEPALHDPESLEAATNVLASHVSEFVSRVRQLTDELDGEERQMVVLSSEAYFAIVEDRIIVLEGILNELESGGIPIVDVSIESDVYNAAVASLVRVRDDRTVNVLVEAEYSGVASDAVRFLVVFVIPVTGMFVLRRLLRRRR